VTETAVIAETVTIARMTAVVTTTGKNPIDQSQLTEIRWIITTGRNPRLIIQDSY